MERFVLWWCGLVGVTDQEAIHIAVGIVAGGSLFVGAYLLVVITFALIAGLAGK